MRTLDRSPCAGPATRWPYLGRPQRHLLFAALLVIVGSCLPWVDTAFGTFIGLAGAGLWTLYVGFIGFAGAFLRRRLLVTAHAGVLGATVAVLVAWQLARLAALGGLGQAWVPGMGLVMVAGGGVLALSATYRLLR